MSAVQNGADIESASAPSSRTPLLGNGPDSQHAVSSGNHPLSDIWTIVSSEYINILLVFLPFALISGAFEWSPTVVFATNFFALMPLASLLSFATEELSKKVG